MNTNKKIAIITGASRGIGKTVAISLAANEYHVVLLSRTEKALREVKSEIIINCLSLTAKETQAIKSVYCLKANSS